ncbi:hypothetical protein COX24_03305 [bacterium (Candidatus Gribaldobacteria) CG23_combo_of_CG06-09_8_20_14_all_37_87_8]|uniref:Transcription elongation factor GreA/GreB C-terminal domain-containing protein n=1 Tax=bacterium (Candidatus Gribaldobacteria) CG23_combo_of_CG06-09_8_20_14_all_37_87_8 TaxID=2014278 RepID=A0A2G9ZEF6_9BACT|nr:MAG: hypothetical protein COX24_03305 [bacterium (Candidatus Gribaldobacteria) CG23_combo_of_CG06-09_8_20_14_all_37_87_8]
MNTPERGSPTKRNFMTRVTEQRLHDELFEAEKKLRETSQAIGEGAGISSDWHDNFAFEQANRDFEFYSSVKALIKRQLEDREIITPREETGDVGIGNQVVVMLEDESYPETFTILGVSDATMGSDWISCESPLGSSLLDKKTGDVVDFLVEKIVRHAKIIEIRPGEGF